MTFSEELQRYLSLGIDLQHRRLERIRCLASTGEPYQHQYEERVKWRQDIPSKLKAVEAVVPATWEIAPALF